jgi:hypothetical protein
LTEPDAVRQRAKNKTRRLGYKPVVVANAHGFIMGQRVEPSNEIAGSRTASRNFRLPAADLVTRRRLRQ